jgi:CobQ/CobB/MinD/ParA nucleotide binding domain
MTRLCFSRSPRKSRRRVPAITLRCGCTARAIRDRNESIRGAPGRRQAADTAAVATVVFCNRKGGVGKTLSTFYTGRWLARAGRDVTLVDLDPQRSLWDIASLLGRPDGVITKRLRLAPDNQAAVAPRDWVLVDTPPALDGSLPALNEADYLVIPVVPEAQEVAQLTKFLSMLEDTRPARPFTRVVGILPVRFIKAQSQHPRHEGQDKRGRRRARARFCPLGAGVEGGCRRRSARSGPGRSRSGPGAQAAGPLTDHATAVQVVTDACRPVRRSIRPTFATSVCPSWRGCWDWAASPGA